VESEQRMQCPAVRLESGEEDLDGGAECARPQRTPDAAVHRLTVLLVLDSVLVGVSANDLILLVDNAITWT